MSFSSDCKAELCKARIDRRDLAVAESYGVLAFCNTFSPSEIRITTANSDFAARLPKLFRKAFSLGFDLVPPENAAGKRSFVLTDPEKIAVIFNTFGYNAQTVLVPHINFGILEDDDSRVAFIRGAFLAGGSVTDPEKRYHLELATSHRSIARETMSILLDMGFSPKESCRGANALLYFKQSDAISDFLTTIGASVTSLGVLTAKVEKEMRNTITRQINCDSANADKTVSAAQEQLTAIRRFAAMYGLEELPDALRDAALLRITNPEASLADLARLSYPPVTKSCLSHRLKKIISLVSEEDL